MCYIGNEVKLYKNVKRETSKFTGYRLFMAVKNIEFGEIQHLTGQYGGIWSSPIFEDGSRFAPTINNNYGIYSVKTLDRNLGRDYRFKNQFLAKVVHYGVVMEHADGYRSSKAEVIELIDIPLDPNLGFSLPYSNSPYIKGKAIPNLYEKVRKYWWGIEEEKPTSKNTFSRIFRRNV